MFACRSKNIDGHTKQLTICYLVITILKGNNLKEHKKNIRLGRGWLWKDAYISVKFQKMVINMEHIKKLVLFYLKSLDAIWKVYNASYTSDVSFHVSCDLLFPSGMMTMYHQKVLWSQRQIQDYTHLQIQLLSQLYQMHQPAGDHKHPRNQRGLQSGLRWEGRITNCD